MVYVLTLVCVFVLARQATVGKTSFFHLHDRISERDAEIASVPQFSANKYLAEASKRGERAVGGLCF